MSLVRLRNSLRNFSNTFNLHPCIQRMDRLKGFVSWTGCRTFNRRKTRWPRREAVEGRNMIAEQWLSAQPGELNPRQITNHRLSIRFRLGYRIGRDEGWRDRRQVEKAFLSLEAEWSEQELDWREQPRRPILIRLINSPRRDYSVSWQVNHAERRSDPRRRNRGIARRRGRWIHRNCTYLCKWPTPLQPLFVLQIWHSTPQEPGGHLCFMTRQSNARLCALPTWPIIADRLIRILRVGFPSV